MSESEFLFVCCQVGAEAALKSELAANHPALRFAFSRPGFLTFKVTEPDPRIEANGLRSIFARTYGHSGGKVDLESLSLPEAAAQAAKLLPALPFRHIHVWRRDTAMPGEQGFEPFVPPEMQPIGAALAEHLVAARTNAAPAVNRTAKAGDWVADIILLDDTTWWVGWHQASAKPSCWPGGAPPIAPRENVVSRAFYKMEEGLLWSRLPIAAGDHCVELGSSPGGACQLLLDRGLMVIGVDPAEMHESILANENFYHLRARAADLKRREFSTAKWLFADANVAPTNTLDAIEPIVSNRRVNVRGMLLTLKLLDWKMADQIPTYLKRIGGWGFRHIRARQLAFNRQEFCVFAMRRKFLARRGTSRRSK